MIERINSIPDFTSAFHDKRIDKRATEFIHKFVMARKSTISKIATNFSQQKAYYRLLENTKFSEDVLIERTVLQCNQNSKGRHVLALNDTVDFNLDAHTGRLDLVHGFGLSSNTTLGFKLHSSLIVDAQSLFPLGFSSMDCWARPLDHPLKKDRNYKSSPLEEKESYKWIKAMDATLKNISNAARITFVADREADIYDVLAKERNAHTYLIIRSKADRKLSSKLKLRTYLSTRAAQFEYELQLEGDVRKKSKSRIANLHVKYEHVTLAKPYSCKNKKLPDSIPINVIEVSEETSSKTKIHWLLYTSHEITTPVEVLQVIQWYQARWNIEQVHRLLKTEGLEIEKTQLEKADAIKKLLVLALSATLRVLQLHKVYSEEVEEPIEIGFDTTEQAFLQQLNTKLEGTTEKLKNPFNPKELKWATWIIARLGDWKGYKTQRPPGVITLQKGLVKFYHMLEGWAIAQEIHVGKR